MKTMLDRLRLPGVDSMDVDGSERMVMHARILQSKPMLKRVFAEFHHLFRELDLKYLSGTGLRIELGAGVAPVRDTYPDVLATDIVDATGLDRTLDAQAMDLPDNSVRAFYGQNCFHHFPDPSMFFTELERTLVPGGGAILIEPYHGPVASWMYARLFATEGFDKNFPTWEVPATGPMNGANQALSYIVFRRDAAQFRNRFPRLQIAYQAPCRNHFEYLLSGGLNFRQLVPDGLSFLVRGGQWLTRPLNRWISLHHVVVIRKHVA
jgi:SAM-dependent methyltransferase